MALKSLRFLGAVVAASLFASAALAAPVPYFNQPIDTVQAALNTVVGSINNAQTPAASLVTASGTTTSAATGLRNTISVTGLVTAASTASAAMTVTNASAAANSQIVCQVNGYAGTGQPVAAAVTPAAGTYSFVIQNVATAAALNATVPVACLIFN